MHASVFYSYIQYSAICARLVRRSLKPELQAAALKAEDTQARMLTWEGKKSTEG